MKQPAAGGRQQQTPVAALEQRHLQHGFELSYLLADGAMAHAQLFRGAPHMPVASGRLKCAQRVERKQAFLRVHL